MRDSLTSAKKFSKHFIRSVSILTIYLSRVLCLSFVLSYSFLSSCHPVILSSCHICGTLSYSLCLRIQTDGVDETEGFEGEGLELEILKMEILKREGVNSLFFV